MTLLATLLVLPTMMAAPVNVTQFHNHENRDGLYVDPAFTRSAVAALKRDLSFKGTDVAKVYAQPLYIEGGPGGKAMLIVVDESDGISALDARTGNLIWQRLVGPPVSLSTLPCGDIDPLGITGTPVVDLATRTLFFDAMSSRSSGTIKKHQIYAMNVDTGTTNSGWPVDMPRLDPGTPFSTP
jgi:outer membrane protein assembly factor BamB